DRRLGGLDSVQVGRPVHRAGPQVPGRAGPEVSSAVLLSTLVSRARRPGACRVSSRCGGAWSGPHLVYAREPPGVHRATELPGESPPATGIESLWGAGEVGVVQDTLSAHPGELRDPCTGGVRRSARGPRGPRAGCVPPGPHN